MVICFYEAGERLLKLSSSYRIQWEKCTFCGHPPQFSTKQRSHISRPARSPIGDHNLCWEFLVRSSSSTGRGHHGATDLFGPGTRRRSPKADPADAGGGAVSVAPTNSSQLAASMSDREFGPRIPVSRRVEETNVFLFIRA